MIRRGILSGASAGNTVHLLGRSGASLLWPGIPLGNTRRLPGNTRRLPGNAGASAGEQQCIPAGAGHPAGEHAASAGERGHPLGNTMASNDVSLSTTRAAGFTCSRRDVLRAVAGAGLSMVSVPDHGWAMTLPEISGPLPDTASRGVLVWDVTGLDYVAEEYFLSGRADVYEPVSMADAPDVASRDNTKDLGARHFARKVLAAARPFTTRLIVYRPRNMQRCSGTVIVETLHPNGGGTSLAWRALHGFFAAHGDVYVGVQHPLTFAGVQAAGPDRYAALAAASPTQLWGMLAQAGAALKSPKADTPLRAYAGRRLLMTGYSYTGVATATFANYHHSAAKIGGRNIFDAYLPMADAQYVRPLDVPVMRLNTQSDFNGFGGLDNRRPDDARYRHYEIAGASHVAAPPPPDAASPPPPGKIPTPKGQPHFSEEVCRATFPAGSRANDFPLELVQAAMFENMYAWLESGRLPPPSMLIDTQPDGSPRVDAWGNAEGGVRYPELTVPIASYGVGSTPPCVLFGYTAPFTPDKCRTLYGDHANYVEKVRAATEALVAARLLLRSGADRLVADAQADGTF